MVFNLEIEMCIVGVLETEFNLVTNLETDILYAVADIHDQENNYGPFRL